MRWSVLRVRIFLDTFKINNFSSPEWKAKKEGEKNLKAKYLRGLNNSPMSEMWRLNNYLLSFRISFAFDWMMKNYNDCCLINSR